MTLNRHLAFTAIVDCARFRVTKRFLDLQTVIGGDERVEARVKVAVADLEHGDQAVQTRLLLDVAHQHQVIGEDGQIADRRPDVGLDDLGHFHRVERCDSKHAQLVHQRGEVLAHAHGVDGGTLKGIQPIDHQPPHASASNVEAAKATIVVDRSNRTFAEQESQRYAYLAQTGFGSVQNAQQAASRIAVALAGIRRDEAALASTVTQVSLQRAEIAQARAALGHSQAVQAQAALNLGYATITSPADGTVGNRTLRVGQYVQAGTELMSVVPTAAAYVVANFKETQLTGVHPGQGVTIRVDMFPDRTYHG